MHPGVKAGCSSTNGNLYYHIAITKNASAYIPAIIAVAVQSRTPRIFTVLSSLASFFPIKKATNPKNANIKLAAVTILRKGESVSLLSSKSADITDNIGINSINIAVVLFGIFLVPLLIWLAPWPILFCHMYPWLKWNFSPWCRLFQKIHTFYYPNWIFLILSHTIFLCFLRQTSI